MMVRFRSWHALPNVHAFVRRRVDSATQHGSWIEDFPWINQFLFMPENEKPSGACGDLRGLVLQEVRQRMGDDRGGSFYVKDERTRRRHFQVAVDDVMDVLPSSFSRVTPGSRRRPNKMVS